MNFGCTVDTVDTVDTNFGVNCVNCVNCAPSSKRSPFAVAMHYQQRQRQQQQQQQEQREGIKTITTTNTHTQTAITILCPGASPALRSPSIQKKTYSYLFISYFKHYFMSSTRRLGLLDCRLPMSKQSTSPTGVGGWVSFDPQTSVSDMTAKFRSCFTALVLTCLPQDG